MAGLSDEDRDALILAAYEAATNVIRHATPFFVDLSLLVRLKDAPTLIEISLYYIDIGEPYVPLTGEPDFSGTSEGGFDL
jgi:hypothetical protein